MKSFRILIALLLAVATIAAIGCQSEEPAAPTTPDNGAAAPAAN